MATTTARGMTQLALTLKGSEELTLRTYRLDVKLRNILFLIQKGSPTLDAVLQNSVFPREEVIEKLRVLLRDQFIELGAVGASGAAPQAARSEYVDTALRATTRPPVAPAATSDGYPALLPGIAMSQARFVLSDFCLDHFGAAAQPLIVAFESAADAAQLQRVLDDLMAQVHEHMPRQWPQLVAKIAEINETAV